MLTNEELNNHDVVLVLLLDFDNCLDTEESRAWLVNWIMDYLPEHPEVTRVEISLNTARQFVFHDFVASINNASLFADKKPRSCSVLGTELLTQFQERITGLKTRFPDRAALEVVFLPLLLGDIYYQLKPGETFYHMQNIQYEPSEIPGHFRVKNQLTNDIYLDMTRGEKPVIEPNRLIVLNQLGQEVCLSSGPELFDFCDRVGAKINLHKLLTAYAHLQSIATRRKSALTTYKVKFIDDRADILAELIKQFREHPELVLEYCTFQTIRHLSDENLPGFALLHELDRSTMTLIQGAGKPNAHYQNDIRAILEAYNHPECPVVSASSIAISLSDRHKIHEAIHNAALVSSTHSSSVATINPSLVASSLFSSKSPQEQLFSIPYPYLAKYFHFFHTLPETEKQRIRELELDSALFIGEEIIPHYFDPENGLTLYGECIPAYGNEPGYSELESRLVNLCQGEELLYVGCAGLRSLSIVLHLNPKAAHLVIIDNSLYTRDHWQRAESFMRDYNETSFAELVTALGIGAPKSIEDLDPHSCYLKQAPDLRDLKLSRRDNNLPTDEVIYYLAGLVHFFGFERVQSLVLSTLFLGLDWNNKKIPSFLRDTYPTLYPYTKMVVYLSNIISYLDQYEHQPCEQILQNIAGLNPDGALHFGWDSSPHKEYSACGLVWVDKGQHHNTDAVLERIRSVTQDNPVNLSRKTA